ncbi:MAG: potassium channel family protein [Albidovulum sp.]
MIAQIAIGSVLMLTTILFSGATLLLVEAMIIRFHPWLTREPHGPKLATLLIGAALWIMGVVSVDVWVWALAFHLLGTLPTLESSVYFALVSFTTLGYGDVVLAQEWRLLGGMCAANGFMIFGFLIAMLVDALRNVRLGQIERRRKS